MPTDAPVISAVFPGESFIESRLKAADLPGIIRLTLINDPVMKSARAALPEFDPRWNQSISAPEIRRGDFPGGKLSVHFGIPPLHLLARSDHVALMRRKCGNLRRARSN